jgi:hypothetical protein
MWDWAIWGALILAGLAGIAALAVLAVRTREAWSDLEHGRRQFVGRLGELVLKGEATADKVGAAGDTPELQESLGRLRVSLAQLAVLREALDEALAPLRPITAFIPRK